MTKLNAHYEETAESPLTSVTYMYWLSFFSMSNTSGRIFNRSLYFLHSLKAIPPLQQNRHLSHCCL